MHAAHNYEKLRIIWKQHFVALGFRVHTVHTLNAAIKCEYSIHPSIHQYVKAPYLLKKSCWLMLHGCGDLNQSDFCHYLHVLGARPNHFVASKLKT